MADPAAPSPELAGVADPASRSLRGLLRGLFRLVAALALCGWVGIGLLLVPPPSVAERARRTSRLSRRVLACLGLEIHVEGAPPSGPFVLVSNHRSYVDVGLLLAYAPAVFLSKATIARWPIAGWFVRLFGTVFVRRGSPQSGMTAYRKLGRILDEGVPVALFPEGATVAPGETRPYKPGAFRLAGTVGVPVVPAAIEYSVAEAAWAQDDDTLLRHFVALFSRPSIGVRLSFGAPLVVDDPEQARVAAQRFIQARTHTPSTGAAGR